MTYKLYSNRYSGHSYKVAMLFALANIAYERVDVDLSVSRKMRSIEFQKDSRFQEVPVLVDGELRISQSNNILTHLSRKHNVMIGADAEQNIRVGEWLFWESNRIGFSIANLRLYKRFMSTPPPELESFLQSRAVDDLTVLESALSNSPFLVGETITIADLSCSGYLYWLDEAGFDIEQWPHIFDWLNRISALPGWACPEDLL